jgi:hypothetical protein
VIHLLGCYHRCSLTGHTRDWLAVGARWARPQARRPDTRGEAAKRWGRVEEESHACLGPASSVHSARHLNTVVRA